MNELNGTGALLATNLRRDKLLLPICVATFAGVAGSSAATTAGLYPDLNALALAAEPFNATPALLALYGRVYDPASRPRRSCWQDFLLADHWPSG